MLLESFEETFIHVKGHTLQLLEVFLKTGDFSVHLGDLSGNYLLEVRHLEGFGISFIILKNAFNLLLYLVNVSLESSLVRITLPLLSISRDHLLIFKFRNSILVIIELVFGVLELALQTLFNLSEMFNIPLLSDSQLLAYDFSL
jgi:hypothetical protein